MKKIISIIAAICVVLIAVIPAFAAETTTECEHSVAFNSEYKTAICSDCGKEVYECERCEYVFCIENRECPICKTKRPAMTNEEKAEDFIEQKKSEFYWVIGMTVITVGFAVIIILSGELLGNK